MVYLISIYENRLFFEDLGINRIAAFLYEHDIDYQFSYIKCNSEIDEQIWERILSSNYVGISVYDNNIDYADQLIKRIKEFNPSIVTFYGSQYASIAYRDILDKNCNIDCIVLGDGEYTVLDIINTSDVKSLKELIRSSPYLASRDSIENKRCRFTDIQSLPWPQYHESYYKKNLHIDLNTSSGCAGNCSFCGSLRRKWSGRTPKSIVEHIKKTEMETNIHSFYFSDSSFEDPGTFGKRRINEIADMLLKNGVKCSFSANIRAESFCDTAEDTALLKKLCSAGFSQLFVGVESGNSHDLKIYNKRASVENNREIIDLLRKVGIEPFWGFIMFNPYSSRQTILENYSFLTDMNTYVTYHYISFLTIYNGTEIYTRALQDKLLNQAGRNHITYEFTDGDIAKLNLWINENLIQTRLYTVVKQTRDFFHFYYYMRPILPGLSETFDNTVNEAKRRLNYANSEFFGILYKRFNLEMGMKQKVQFENELFEIWNQLCGVQTKILRQYYSLYKNKEV